MVETARVLVWEGCSNVRDLGGLRGRRGETRSGRLVRADNLAKLTPAGRQALLDYGVRTIIDLRLPAELEVHAPPFSGHPDVLYRNLSFVDPAVEETSGLGDVADIYLDMLERFGSRVADVMRAIADAPEGVILFHCHAGKDRTGVISALVLRLAGIDLEEIGRDYALTDALLAADPFSQAEQKAWLESDPARRVEREAEIERMRARESVMIRVIEGLEAEHGSVEGYLRSNGLSDDDIERVRARLLD
ncbi:MAG TPA: tyrosine-protein phosphatase [Chloroflexota bacterium]|nr:tyrosine-protein phosphatase [Chloroflexota bacterium]